VRIGADWSKTSNLELAGIFDYRTLRGRLELGRDLGSRMEVRALGEYRRKEAFDSGVESYDERAGEIEMNGDPRDGDRLDTDVRFEDRTYRSDQLGIPSSDIGTASARYELRASEVFRPHVDTSFEKQNYRGESGIFQDNQSWKAELGTDILLNKLSHHAVEDTLSGLLAADWRLRIGGTTEIFRASSVDADSASFLPAFNSFGGVAGIAREGGDSFWFDLRVEAGRRVYRDHLDTLHLVFEGLNLSLASSDYTYLGASFLCEWNPVQWLRAEAFVQWDDEVHDSSQDDFRLWIANLSLTYPF
jgi:hypothetical protein